MSCYLDSILTLHLICKINKNTILTKPPPKDTVKKHEQILNNILNQKRNIDLSEISLSSSNNINPYKPLVAEYFKGTEKCNLTFFLESHRTRFEN